MDILDQKYIKYDFSIIFISISNPKQKLWCNTLKALGPAGK